MALALAQSLSDAVPVKHTDLGPSVPARNFSLPTRNRGTAASWEDLSTAERELITVKRNWAKGVWELLQRERRGRKLYTVATAIAAGSDPAVFPALARSGNLGGNWMSRTNYQRTIKALTIDGMPRWDRLELLIPKASSGRPSLCGTMPEFVRDVLYLYLNSRKPALSQCWRDVAKIYRRNGVSQDDIPPLSSVEHFLHAHVSDKMIARYRGGAKQHADKGRGYISRRHDYAVGDVFCADHRKVDSWSRVPDPERPGEFMAARLYCSTLEDMRSRYRVVSLLYKDQNPNHRIVAEMLWRAIILNGYCPPRIFYIDNGKDFCKAGLTLPVSLRTAKGDPVIDPCTGKAYEHSVFRELGIAIGEPDDVNIKLSRGYNGKEKPVEGSYGMDARLHDRMQVAFTGNTAVERARLNGEHYDGNVMRLPSVEQAQLAYQEFLDEFHSMKTESRICPADTREKAWTTMRKPTHAPMTERQLYRAFLLPQALCPIVKRTPRGFSGVYHSGWTYSHPELDRLGMWNKPVMIKLDLRDEYVPRERGSHPPRVFLFHPDGRFIGEARADGTAAAFATTDFERAELADLCHDINAGDAMIKEEFRLLTGRCRMISDPQQMLGRPGHPPLSGGVDAPVIPPRPSRKQLTDGGGRRDDVDSVPGDYDADGAADMMDFLRGRFSAQIDNAEAVDETLSDTVEESDFATFMARRNER